MRVIAHGGAGGVPDEPASRQATLDEATRRGVDADTPLDAVEAALGVLESNPRFNAGVGGAVQSDGVVRTDAGVMTADREIGAACSMPGVEHAASVARVVHSETPHIFISGDHAVDLASEFDIETGVDLLTDETRERYEAEDPPQGGPREHLDWLATRFGSGDDQAGGGSGSDEESEDDAGRAPDHDTVGAVATTARRSRRRPPRAAGRSRSRDASATYRRSDRASSVPRPAARARRAPVRTSRA